MGKSLVQRSQGCIKEAKTISRIPSAIAYTLQAVNANNLACMVAGGSLHRPFGRSHVAEIGKNIRQTRRMRPDQINFAFSARTLSHPRMHAFDGLKKQLHKYTVKRTSTAPCKNLACCRRISALARCLSCVDNMLYSVAQRLCRTKR